MGLVMLAGAPHATGAQSAPARADQLALLINRARVERSVLPLARSSELDVAAQAHSESMVRDNFLDHTGMDGSTPQQRAEQAGYHVPEHSGWIVVEVISAISDDPAGPLDWWLNQSPEIHGKVLTDPRWREMGVGYAAGGEFGNYWTVLVGCRPDVVPVVVLDGKSYEHTERCGDPAALPAQLTVSTPNASAGGDLELRWRGIASPSARDWIGLYRPGDADDAYLAWMYVSCGQTPLSARAAGWCWFRMPPQLADGTYELRMFPNDSFQPLTGAPADVQLVAGHVFSPSSVR